MWFYLLRGLLREADARRRGAGLDGGRGSGGHQAGGAGSCCACHGRHGCGVDSREEAGAEGDQLRQCDTQCAAIVKAERGLGVRVVLLRKMMVATGCSRYPDGGFAWGRHSRPAATDEPAVATGRWQAKGKGYGGSTAGPLEYVGRIRAPYLLLQGSPRVPI